MNKEVNNQAQQNNLWPLTSTPTNNILNIPKTNIRRNRIWVRISRVTRNILGWTRLLLLFSRFSLLFLKTISRKNPSQKIPLSRIYISLPKEPPKSARGESLPFVSLYKNNKKISLQKETFSDPKKEIHFPLLFSSLL